MSEQFEVIDTDSKESYAGGMMRNSNEGKRKPHLVRSGPMYERWVGLMTAGAIVYDDDNWMEAEGQEEYDRFRESACRHFDQWYAGDRDEDHAAAVYFNVNGAEYVRDLMVAAEEYAATHPTTVRDAYAQAMDEAREATQAGPVNGSEAEPLDLFADQMLDKHPGSEYVTPAVLCPSCQEYDCDPDCYNPRQLGPYSDTVKSQLEQIERDILFPTTLRYMNPTEEQMDRIEDDIFHRDPEHDYVNGTLELMGPVYLLPTKEQAKEALFGPLPHVDETWDPQADGGVSAWEFLFGWMWRSPR